MTLPALSAADIIERIDELLELTYRQADLGNLDDPLAETVYIALSRQTRSTVYQRVFAELRQRWPKWRSLLATSTEELEEVLAPSGLHRQRASQLRALLAAIDADNQLRNTGPYGSTSGDLTLDYLVQFSEEEALEFLTALPGIGPKSARCIASYSLGHDTFAVDTHVERILDRLDLVDAPSGKVKHEDYDSIVPRGMRKRLHMNLVHHGRAVCRSSTPRCGDCMLVSFCEEGRKRVEALRERPTFVDLFAGGGGLSAGYAEEGFSPAAAVEMDKDSAQTYRANHPGTPVLEADVTQLSGEDLLAWAPAAGAPDAIIAGTPCQGYSAAGARDPEDPRNTHYKHVTRLARELSAASITIENVPGLTRVNGKGFLDEILEELRDSMGWAARYELVASEFGVPQNRHRFIFLAAHESAVDQFAGEAGPLPTHHPLDRDEDDERFHGLPRTPSLEAALKDLPELESGVQAEWLVNSEHILLNGSTMKHSKRVIEKISKIAPGEGPISYRRLTRDMARTLVAGHRALPVHPWLDRTISVREAARIQGFPDDHVFCGPRSNQPIQVANAVPPPMAAAVAQFHRKVIDLDRAGDRRS